MENIILIFLGEINNESLLLSKHCLVSRKSYVELQTQSTDTRKGYMETWFLGQHEASSFFKNKQTKKQKHSPETSCVSCFTCVRETAYSLPTPWLLVFLPTIW